MIQNILKTVSQFAGRFSDIMTFSRGTINRIFNNKDIHINTKNNAIQRVAIKNQDAKKSKIKKESRSKERLRQNYISGQIVYKDKAEDVSALEERISTNQGFDTNIKKGCFSQHDEEYILGKIFHDLELQKLNIVEIGCGHNGGNSLACILIHGGKGLFIDADSMLTDILEQTIKAQSHEIEHRILTSFVTKENINSLISNYFRNEELDCVSIDIDGVDYHIFLCVQALKPKICIVEFNPFFGNVRKITVRYSDNFSRKKKLENKNGEMVWAYPKGLFGASLPALKHSAKLAGYTFKGAIPNSNNAVFIRNDLSSQTDVAKLLVKFSTPKKKTAKESHLSKYNAMSNKKFMELFGPYIDVVSYTWTDKILLLITWILSNLQSLCMRIINKCIRITNNIKSLITGGENTA